MKSKSIAKLSLDVIGIGLLAFLLYLSLAFRAAPDSFMDPGFPILSNDDWTPALSITLNWHEYPQRMVSKDPFAEVAYYSMFSLDDDSRMFPNPYVPTRIEPTTFSVIQTVTRYSDADQALMALEMNYEEYRSTLKPYHSLYTDIPGLDFSGKADQYYIWCDQIAPRESEAFDAEKVETCYYRAVYGRHYSEIRFFMWPFRGDGRKFSVELFNDVVRRADWKLAHAWK